MAVIFLEYPMSAFGDAFKAARASGDKTFTFGGKSYNTKTADDAKAPSRATPQVLASANDSRDPIGSLIRGIGAADPSSRDTEAGITRGIPADIYNGKPNGPQSSGQLAANKSFVASVKNGNNGRDASWDDSSTANSAGMPAAPSPNDYQYATGGMIGQSPNAKKPNPPFKPFGTKPTAEPS